MHICSKKREGGKKGRREEEAMQGWKVVRGEEREKGRERGRGLGVDCSYIYIYAR